MFMFYYTSPCNESSGQPTLTAKLLVCNLLITNTTGVGSRMVSGP